MSEHDEGEEWKRDALKKTLDDLANAAEKSGTFARLEAIVAEHRAREKTPTWEPPSQFVEVEWTTRAGLLGRVCRYEMEDYDAYDKLMRKHFGPDHVCMVPRYWRCGYVCVPSRHPAFAKSYGLHEAVERLHCPGGVTFSAMDTMERWWVGFDCNHAWDTEEDWPMARVAEACEGLAEQIAEMKA